MQSYVQKNDILIMFSVIVLVFLILSSLNIDYQHCFFLCALAGCEICLVTKSKFGYLFACYYTYLR